MAARSRLVHSIGHSSLPGETFLSHLTRFQISLLVDVRRRPASRRHPQFDGSALERLLARESIDYLHLGGSLGGFRDVPYERYAESEEFLQGIGRLEESLSRPGAFMCAEKHPWQCHRRFIAEALSRRGWDVRHIVDGQVLLP